MVVARQLRRPQLEGYLVELAGKAERHLVILVVDWRAGIHADIKGFVNRHEDGSGMRYFLGADFLVVHLQDAGATFTETGAFVSEVKHDSVFARRERLFTFPSEPLQIQKVVSEHRLPLHQVKSISTEMAAQSC